MPLKHLFFSAVLLFCFSTFYTQTNNSVPVIAVDALMAFTNKQLGIKYKYGSINPKVGFDCSGFVYYTFKHFNITVPRASMDYEKTGKLINPDSCKIGDIIVFTGTNAKNRKPGHVGIVISGIGEGLRFVHSSSNTKQGGVKISTFKESPYYAKRFIKIVRLSNVEVR